MHDIFISYANKDKPIAQSLAKALNDEGYNVWWDIDIPTGSTFDAEIEKAIKGAKCVIVLWSEHSVKSEWVHIEAAEGRSRNVLIPVLIADVDIPFAFRRRQTLDLSGWLKDKKDPSFDRLLADVNLLFDKNENEKSVSHLTDELRKEKDDLTNRTTKKSNSKTYLISGGILILLVVLAYFFLPFGNSKKGNLKIGDRYQGGIVFDIGPNGNSIKICSEKDLGSLNWYQAQDSCKNYDEGGHHDWYLPTIDELDLMYNNLFLNELGGFKKEWYWSSSETDGQAWEQHFTDGYKQNDGGGNESQSFVRAVRSVVLNQLKIGDKYAGGIIFELDSTGLHGKVGSESDLGFVNWYEAKKICETYSFEDYDDWYLPSRDELNLLYNNLYLKGIGNFNVQWYWSSSETDGKAWEQDFLSGLWQNDGGGNESQSYVRAVRKF